MNLVVQNLLTNKIVKFLIVGGTNTLLFLLLFGIFEYLDFYYIVSSILAYLICTIISFQLNKKWVFSSNGRHQLRSFLLFVLINLVSMGANLLALYVLKEVFLINVYIAQGLALLVSTLFNYIGYNYLFKK